MTSKITGTVFDIQRYSIHDGPGIRTLVFMKGCPLSCKWCSNPEGQKSQPEIRFIPSKCVGQAICKGVCVKACPVSAISLSSEGKPITDRKLCQACGKCAEACLYKARQLSGTQMTVEDLLLEVLKDEPYYRQSGGGITMSGGEPLAQFKFTRQFLQECKQRSLHTAIETCGYVPWDNLRDILDLVDLVYYDIKHMVAEKHKELMGTSNDLILENARKLLSTNKTQVVIRVPIVPGCNDSEENIEAIARFVANSGGRMMELLPYHRFGVSKYSQFDLGYELKEVQIPTEEHLQKLRGLVKPYGIEEVTGAI
ncbi:glycyl-radical enzyme activating protein [Chloroflexota bacterium]